MIAALSAGCGASASATEKQLSELRAELAKVRAESAMLSGRLDALERARSAARPPAAPGGSAAERDRPVLDIVQLRPAGDTASSADQRSAGQAGYTPGPGGESPGGDGAGLAAELAADEDPGDAERMVLRSGRGGEVVAEVSGKRHSTDKNPSPLPRRSP